MVVIIVLVVVMMVVVMVMLMVVGDDAIDGDVVGDDDGDGRGALTWGTCKWMTVWWVHAPLFLPNYLKSPLGVQNIYCSILDPPLIMFKLGLSSQFLQNTWLYKGKTICVKSFSGIPHVDLPCGAPTCGKNPTLLVFFPARVNGNDTWI